MCDVLNRLLLTEQLQARCRFKKTKQKFGRRARKANIFFAEYIHIIIERLLKGRKESNQTNKYTYNQSSH